MVPFKPMRKGLLIGILLAVLIPLLGMGSEGGKVEETARDFLRKVLSQKAFEIKELKYSFDPGLGLYVVAVLLKEGGRERPVLLYLSRDMRFVIAGRVYDASSGRELSRDHFETLMGSLPAGGPEKVNLEGVSLRGPVLGKGEEVILVSNPHCSHCRQLVPRLLERVKRQGGFSLYYKGMFFGRDRELEEAMECVRQKRPELFWDFVRECYSRPKGEALKWLRSILGEDFLKGCRSEAILEALQRDDREVREKIGVKGIPAVIFRGRLYEGTRSIERALFGTPSQAKEVSGKGVKAP
ncbi:MAG: hypothetical protein DRG31_06660 [Deltaproteobacteria bacterium]|nr:MAG: hypothetical protein DRG31_06660 [Deltaproteobacteria bacterium]